MTGRRARRVSILVLLLGATAPLLGCSTVGIVPEQSLRFDVTLTPAEARADLANRSDELQSVLGGEWSNEDNYMADACSDRQGYHYFGGRNRLEPVDDRQGAAKRVTEWWKERGYAVSRADWGETVMLGGIAENGMDITLHLQEKRTWFQTDGPCLVGDWKAISDDDFANKRNDFPRNRPDPNTGGRPE
ncbi:hypothetical protein ACFVU2_01355 [Leifsonia sp. NPDC058194]|uniref:hypothetical protein n=1 Tax=Leifsonia sp. NPDC058194 TaxID=3346374 RepID=UPI0036D92A42